ncbi:MAG: hypothetical protein JRD89_06620 [Deltaproteobacteria bacterium]|nr:hypothetical protein [Deltaproteobacteria bacterium]
MLFLDPDRPIASCTSESCDGCPVGTTLHCHFTLRELTRFLLIVLPSFLAGGAGIYHRSGWMLIAWIMVILGFFGFLEIRVMCSHCPHYAEPGNSLKCWANYGSPKLWRYRPGPMTHIEKVAFFSGFLVVWGYPLLFLLPGAQWFLLIVYVLTTAGFFIMLRRYFCSQCINFACPLNRVDDTVRRGFFERNRGVAEAWGIDTKGP